MARSGSSKQWLKRHVSDPYVQKAKAQGLRSRAAFKLEEVDQRDRLLRAGAKVVDLGAAPGSWSEYAAKRVGSTGRVVAIDLLEVAPAPGVAIVRGDFLDPQAVAAVREAMGGDPADVVLCDLAPNISGIASADQARAAELVHAAIDFCVENLRPEGAFLVKVFQGEGIDPLRAEMKRSFRQLQVRKPEASRARSSEVYLLGRGFEMV